MTDEDVRTQADELDVTPATTTAGTGGTDGNPYGTIVSETPSSLRWSSIVGGAVAALGVGVLLYSLGLALGLSAIDPGDAGSLRPTSIFTGVWALVVSLVALFVGGFVSARGAHALTRLSGSMHGLVMWGLTVIAGMWLIGSIASMVVSGAAAVGGTAARALGDAAPMMPRMAEDLGLGVDDTLAPINERLRAEGKPPVTSQQLQAVTSSAVREAARNGRLDRDSLVNAIGANTSLTRADADQLATRIEVQYAQAQTRIKQTMAEARHDALSVAEDTGTAFWGVFGALLLGLIAAIGGALIGSGNHVQKGREPHTTTRGRPAPRVQPREAYP